MTGLSGVLDDFSYSPSPSASKIIDAKPAFISVPSNLRLSSYDIKLPISLLFSTSSLHAVDIDSVCSFSQLLINFPGLFGMLMRAMSAAAENEMVPRPEMRGTRYSLMMLRLQDLMNTCSNVLL